MPKPKRIRRIWIVAAMVTATAAATTRGQGTMRPEIRAQRDVAAALAAKEHEVFPRGPCGNSTGITAVGVDPASGTLDGAADVRRERDVPGW